LPVMTRREGFLTLDSRLRPTRRIPLKVEL
jgi:hypothetical protein